MFARVFNTGNLFFGNSTDGDGYFTPKASLKSPIYAAGIWVGGIVDDEIRVAGSTYDGDNFWPGPLAEGGRPVNPGDCSPFDRIYNVSRADIAAVVNGDTRRDVTQWPVELGAPYYVDTNGNVTRDPDEPRLTRAAGDTTPLNIAAGERPDIIGDQGLYWVMNDAGGNHGAIATPILGIEVRVLAFSFSRSDALGQATFYQYTIINKSPNDITQAYVTVFSDPDLGGAGDDYVGSDPESGLMFVYNGASTDPVYGVPPAAGLDFFQGPVVADGDDEGTDPDTLQATAISYFQNNLPAGDPRRDPTTGVEFYRFMQGLWGDGTPMRARENGYGQPGSVPVTKFMFPGNPITREAWSEFNPGAGLAPNPPGDRRFAISTGPFTLERNAQQVIVFGIVFAQGSSNIQSVTALRAADVLAQTAYDADFQLAPPPDSPPLCREGDSVTFPGSGNCLEAVNLNGKSTLVWGYPPTNPNFLGQFDQVDPLLAQQDVPDRTYTFEGFNVYRYQNGNFDDTQRQLVATYDVINGITTVRETQFDPVLGQERLFVTARGTDAGVRFSYDLPGLTNFQDYYYGVSAYAYNQFSIPQINEGQATLITVRPSNLTNSVETRSNFGQTLEVTPVGNARTGGVSVQVVDPTAVTGNTYRVEFFRPTNADGSISGFTTYRVINTSTGATALDGQEYFNRTGRTFLQAGGRTTVVDGLQFRINADAIDFQTFITTRNANGLVTVSPNDPTVRPDYASFRTANPAPGVTVDTGFPFIPDSLGGPNGTLPGSTLPGRFQQQSTRAQFGIQQGINPRAYDFGSFRQIVTRSGQNSAAINGDSYEWRFTGTSVAYRLLDDQGTLTVPFELWNIGTTVDDASDDYRMIPIFRAARDSVSATGMVVASGTPNQFNLGPIDSGIDGGTTGTGKDPISDQIYWYQPLDTSPGQAGYNAYANGGTVNPDAIGPQVFAGIVLIGINARPAAAGSGRVYDNEVPEQGTVFRIVTSSQNRSGDAFTFSTAGFNLTDVTDAGREEALDRIAAVPNPYLGQSAYELGNTSSVIRFTNLPSDAVTIRIFTVSGSLVTTLRKEGSSRSLDWNLQTSNNLPVASGMYLVHVDVAGVGERTLKLGIVNRRTQIRAF